MLALVAATSAYAPVVGPARSPAAASSIRCSASEEGPTRRAVLARAITAGSVGLLGGGVAQPALAGYVTSLGFETTLPKDAEKDDELLASSQVQRGLKNVVNYRVSARNLYSKFSSDPNVNLIPSIRSDFDFSKLRDDLNLLTSVFDEQTQLTTDRLTRAILYDLTELENASRFKNNEEPVRTEKKVQNVAKWFVKLDGDFATLLSYFA